MYMGILSACVSVYLVHIWWPLRPEEGARSFGSGVTGVWKLPCGCWESNWFFWKNSQAELHLQPLTQYVFITAHIVMQREGKVQIIIKVQSVGYSWGQGPPWDTQALVIMLSCWWHWISYAGGDYTGVCFITFKSSLCATGGVYVYAFYQLQLVGKSLLGPCFLWLCYR